MLEGITEETATGLRPEPGVGGRTLKSSWLGSQCQGSIRTACSRDTHAGTWLLLFFFNVNFSLNLKCD